jgi:hypothetical protein
LILARLGRGVTEDLYDLPSTRLGVVALEWIARIREEPYLGPRLDWRRGGDLSMCRKLYFDEEDTPFRWPSIPARGRAGGPRFRIVYELLPRDDRPEVALVLAVGEKKKGAEGVYSQAAGRR